MTIFSALSGLTPLFLELRNAGTQGVIQAGISAGVDFATHQNRDWQYYVGVAAGATALATGSPGAALTFYATCEALDLLVFKSPEGEGFDLFVDGVAQGSIVNYAVNEAWERVRVVLGGAPAPGAGRRVEFYNGDDENGDGFNWLGLGAIVAVGAGGLVPRASFPEGTPYTVQVTIRDGRDRKGTLKFYYPYFVEQERVEAYAREFVSRTNACIDGVVETVSLARPLKDVPSHLEPGPSTVNAKMGFSLNRGRFRTRISVPTWKEGLTTLRGGVKKFRGDDALQDEVHALRMLIGYPTGEGFDVGPCDARGVVMTGLAIGKYSFRSS